jgi:glutamine cyclotransferase
MKAPFPRLLRIAQSIALSATLLPFCCKAVSAASYEVVAKFPHSTDNYTEGLFYLDGLFYEGTGRNGHSAVIVSQPETGKILQRIDLPQQYFGEGIVDWGPNIYEWTWQSHICFVYDRFALRLVKQFTYRGEGWGMTRTTKEIITSDGSATLRFRDPATSGKSVTLWLRTEQGPSASLMSLSTSKERYTRTSGIQTS